MPTTPRSWTSLPGRDHLVSSAGGPQRQALDAGSQIEHAPDLARLIEYERAIARATMAVARDVEDYDARTSLLEIAVGQTWFAATLVRQLDDGSRQRHVTDEALPDELRHLTCVQTIARMSAATRLRALALVLRRVNRETAAILARAGPQWAPTLREMWRTHRRSAAQCRYLAKYMVKESARN